jgi:hypothetical protein
MLSFKCQELIVQKESKAMAKTHECTIGNLRQGTMRYITTPRFNQNWCAEMATIGATWGNVGGNGSWIFKPEHITQVVAWARFYFPMAAAQPVAPVQPAPLTDKEQFAVAMGLSLREQEDLS